MGEGSEILRSYVLEVFYDGGDEPSISVPVLDFVGCPHGRPVPYHSTLLAVQEGLLDLDVPITRYLPGFAVHSRFEPAPQERITLRLLLANRAGFTHEAPVGYNYEADAPGFAAHVRSISRNWLRFPVGERYRYSNLGFDLAGDILGRATGLGYAEWLRRKLFAPLGMRESTVDPEVYADAANRAVGNHKGHARVPLVTPLVASGITAHSLSLLKDQLRSTGIVPMQGGGVTANVAQEAMNIELEPGGALSVALITGDFDMSGIGTVTQAKKPSLRVIGVEPENAPCVAAAIDAGELGRVAFIEANFSNERALELTPSTWRWYQPPRHSLSSRSSGKVSAPSGMWPMKTIVWTQMLRRTLAVSTAAAVRRARLPVRAGNSR